MQKDEEGDPERPVGRERNGPEGIAGSELPHAREQLRNAAVGERERQHRTDPPRTDQVPVYEAEHHRGGGETGQPERRRVGRLPESGGPARGRVHRGRRGHVRLAAGAWSRYGSRSVTTGFHMASSWIDGWYGIQRENCTRNQVRNHGSANGRLRGADGRLAALYGSRPRRRVAQGDTLNVTRAKRPEVERPAGLPPPFALALVGA